MVTTTRLIGGHSEETANTIPCPGSRCTGRPCCARYIRVEGGWKFERRGASCVKRSQRLQSSLKSPRPPNMARENRGSESTSPSDHTALLTPTTFKGSALSSKSPEAICDSTAAWGLPVESDRENVRPGRLPRDYLFNVL